MKEALKLALEALEYWDVHGGLHQPTEEAITALRLAIDVQNMASESTYKAALAQPAQEPENRCVRELREFAKLNQGTYIFPSWDGNRVLKYLGDTTTPQQEPWCMKMNGCKTKCEDCPVEVAEQEHAAHAVIAGALFDFMGWLTSREERIVLSSADEASPAVDAISNFAKMRGLSLDDAKVQDWNTTPPQPEERNFCPRCGKRTADLTVIHTCTPPQENT